MTNNQKFNEKITIIIVMYEESFDLICKTLEKITNFKKIIIDNAGDINIKNNIISKFAVDKYVSNKKNIGFSAGYNQGLKLSETEFTLVLGPDCKISEESIFLLFSKFIKYPDSLIVSPTSYDESGSLTYSGGPLPENGEKNLTLRIDGDVCVESALGACMFFKTSELIDNNLFFDENLFLYFSDDDLCRRIGRVNRSIIQIFDAKCVHQHGTLKVRNKLKKIFVREYYMTYDKFYYFFKINKHHDLISSFRKRFLLLVFKLFIKILTLQISDAVKIFSRLFAYVSFMLRFIWRDGRVA